MGTTRTVWHVMLKTLLDQCAPPRFEVRCEVQLSSEPLRADYLLLRRVEPEKAKRGRCKGQQHLVQAVAQIVGKHWRNTPEDVAARAALMAPILKQNEAVRQALRAHRNPDDVNPDTGEVDPTAPAAEPVVDPKATP